MSTRSQMTVIALAAALVLTLGGNVVDSHHKCGHRGSPACEPPPPPDEGGGGLCVVPDANDPLNSGNVVGKSFTLVERLRLPTLNESEVVDKDAIELGRALAGRQFGTTIAPVVVDGITNPIVFAASTRKGELTQWTLRFYLRDPAIATPLSNQLGVLEVDENEITRQAGFQTVDTPNRIRLVVDADFNGDGVPDFVTVIGGPNPSFPANVGVYLGVYDNTNTLSYGPRKVIDELEEAVNCPEGARDCFGRTVAVGDIDGDGRDELAIGAEGGGKGKNARHGKVFIYDDAMTNFKLLQKIDSEFLGLGLTTGDFFGSSVAFGQVDTEYVDLIVGAWGRDNGEVFVFSGSSNGSPFTPGGSTLTVGTNKQDRLGFQLATALDPSTGGHHVIASTAWFSDSNRAEFFAFPADFPASSPHATLEPLDSEGFSAFWGSSGLRTGDINGDGQGEVLMGVPGAHCEEPGLQGLAYLYFVHPLLPGPEDGPAKPTPLVFHPDADVDPTDKNKFGAGSAIITTEIPPAPGSSDPSKSAFVFIGEPWREDPDRGLGNDGQIYIYKYTPPS